MLLRALSILIFASLLLIWLFILYLKHKRFHTLVLTLGALFIMFVGLFHVFETEHWFIFMHWGSPNSMGHYLDFSSAIMGVVLIVFGIILQLAASKKKKFDREQ